MDKRMDIGKDRVNKTFSKIGLHPDLLGALCPRLGSIGEEMWKLAEEKGWPLQDLRLPITLRYPRRMRTLPAVRIRICRVLSTHLTNDSWTIDRSWALIRSVGLRRWDRGCGGRQRVGGCSVMTSVLDVSSACAVTRDAAWQHSASFTATRRLYLHRRHEDPLGSRWNGLVPLVWSQRDVRCWVCLAHHEGCARVHV